jgi:signal transduction histidine kinase
VLLGAVLPLALLGLWTTRSAARSGRELLESQLTSQVALDAAEVELRWAQHKGDLLMLGENEPARAALTDSTGRATPVPAFVQRAFSQMTAFNQVVIRDRNNRARWTLESPSFPSAARDVRIDPAVRGIGVQVPITDLSTGDTIGTVDASLRVAALLQPVALVASASGPLIAVFAKSQPLVVPTGADERLFTDERVEWNGHRWLAVRRPIDGIGIDLVIAGALTPYVEPFERSATRGALVLMVAASVIVMLVLGLTRRMTRDVERQLAQREALAAVGEFASELAHEVRNPLTAIRLDLQRVEESASDVDTVRTIVPRVLRQIDRLDRAVSGALRVTRGTTVKPRLVGLRDILDGACRSASPEFTRRGGVLSVDLPKEPIELDADAAALEQMFVNLLINAAQALAPRGVARLGAERRNGKVEVTITDNGAGMTARQLKDVREPYRSLRPDGTGLGLKIARRIAANHRGELELISTRGTGTTVRVTLPLRAGVASLV